MIFDIQRFSLHDGPGIRTTVFFKGCPLRCAWCQNPESLTFIPEIAFYEERCRECYSCKEVCPKDAVQCETQKRIAYSRCDTCGACVTACPSDALRMLGKEWARDALVKEILRDKDFFVDSRGGVTLSGGEPMSQVSFLEGFLPKLKDEGIHITLETCGMWSWERIERILPALDLIYFDIKLMNSGRHKEFTGQGNRVILENFVRLSAIFRHLQARMPVIPGINDDYENISATARFLEENHHTTIHCLPYHRMGEAKLQRIRTDLGPLDKKSITGEDLKYVKEIFKGEGIDAVTYD